jgi:hypothetical protein
MILSSHPELYNRWNWGGLSWNKNFTMNDIVAHPELYDRWYQEPEGRSGPSWDWEQLSKNQNFTMADIVAHPELYDRWDWRELSWNRNFTMADIVAHPELYDRWNWEVLSYNPNLTMADIIAHPELYDRWYQEPNQHDLQGRSGPSWNWDELSKNPNFAMADIVAHPELYNRWDWGELSWNRNFTMADIVAHPELYDRWYQEPDEQNPDGRFGPSWDWQELSGNPNFTFDEIVSHPELYDRWDWYNLSRNRNFTVNDIVAHPELYDRWNWEVLSENPNLTMGDIVAHPELYDKRNWSYLSQYVQTSPADIVSHPEIHRYLKPSLGKNKFGGLYKDLEKALDVFTVSDICQYHIVLQKVLRDYLVKISYFDRSDVNRLNYQDLCRLAGENALLNKRIKIAREKYGEQLREGVPMAQEVILEQPGGRRFQQYQREFQERAGQTIDQPQTQINPYYNRLYEVCQDPNSTRAEIQHLAHEMDLDILLARLNPEQRTKENYCQILTKYIETTMGRTPQ